jgi:hypothetical protein
MFAGPICGASMNPALAGAALFPASSSTFGFIWRRPSARSARPAVPLCPRTGLLQRAAPQPR